MSEKNIVVFDLDGTIALIDHRLHYIKRDDPDWEAFHMACVDDVPNEAVITALQAMAQSGHVIMIMTGRSEIAMNLTQDWLEDNNALYDNLIMRSHDDFFTPDHILKKQWIEARQIKDQIVCAYDDRDKVVSMWRNEGIPCFQVAPGNF